MAFVFWFLGICVSLALVVWGVEVRRFVHLRMWARQHGVALDAVPLFRSFLEPGAEVELCEQKTVVDVPSRSMFALPLREPLGVREMMERMERGMMITSPYLRPLSGTKVRPLPAPKGPGPRKITFSTPVLKIGEKTYQGTRFRDQLRNLEVAGLVERQTKGAKYRLSRAGQQAADKLRDRLPGIL